MNKSMNGSIAEQLFAKGLISKEDLDGKKKQEAIQEQNKHEKIHRFNYFDFDESVSMLRDLEEYDKPLLYIDVTDGLFDQIKKIVLKDPSKIKKIVPIVHNLRDQKIISNNDYEDPYNVIPFVLNLRKNLLNANFINSSEQEQRNRINHLFKVREKEFPQKGQEKERKK